MIIQNLHISDPHILRELFQNILHGDAVPSSKMGCPSDVSFRTISPHCSLIWGSYSYLSGFWQTTGGIYISISIDDIPFYFNGKSVGNLSNPLEVTITYPEQQIDISFKYPYRALAVYLSKDYYIQKYENLLGKEYDAGKQANLVNFRSQQEKDKLLNLLIPITYGYKPDSVTHENETCRHQLADTIVESLILGINFDTDTMLDRTACRYLGLQAHSLLLSHPNTKLSLTQVSKTLKAPLRSIQQGFTELYGTSIIEYHKRFRLFRMRDYICKHGACKVTQIAKDFGFAHAGRTAQMYKETFGVLPSQDSASSRANALQNLGISKLPSD